MLGRLKRTVKHGYQELRHNDHDEDSLHSAAFTFLAPTSIPDPDAIAVSANSAKRSTNKDYIVISSIMQEMGDEMDEQEGMAGENVVFLPRLRRFRTQS